MLPMQTAAMVRDAGPSAADRLNAVAVRSSQLEAALDVLAALP